ncbi:MAG: hypothetical protein KC591_07775 [Gemmatimonadetes bacterium]|nr:hypothetical protein [Gemmatimonadota bacterium]
MTWPFRRREAEVARPRIVDPTSELLGEVTGIESKIPWAALGITVLFLLWLPNLTRLSDTPLRAGEIEWIRDVQAPADQASDATSFARTLSSATWAWAGAEIEGVDVSEITPEMRARARIPSFAAAFAALLMLYFLGRIVIGDAAALLAAALLAVSDPWRQAGTTVHLFVVGELLVLFGVAWAVVLQSRHREVEMAGVTATRIGLAGVFLGVGLLLAPAAFATLVTTLVIWLLLGLRRTNSATTTLPVRSPREKTFFAAVGTVVLAGAALLSAWCAEVLVGGGSGAFPKLFPAAAGWASSDASLWPDLFERFLAPTHSLAILVVIALPIILVIRWVEWSGGKPWHAAGLLPWLFLGAWLFLEMRLPEHAARTELPVTLPPLFVLGLGWLILRGLQPGRYRRQEYSFLITWLLMTVLLVPFTPAGHPHDPFLAASVVLLPAMFLVAGRGARALWEAEDGPLARGAILVIAYLPVVLLAATGAARLAHQQGWGDALRDVRPLMVPVLLVAVACGILSELISVRPDPIRRPRKTQPSSRRGRRGAGRRRGSRGGRRKTGRGR